MLIIIESNFVQLFPQLDWRVKKEPPRDQHADHCDAFYSSELLNCKISFYWRHYVNDDMINTFLSWQTSPPDVIVIGQSFNLPVNYYTISYKIRLKLN